MKDRRKLERFDLKLPAEIVVIGTHQEKEIFNLITKNICAGGAFFTTNPLPKGTQVQINLTLLIERLKKLTGAQGYIKIRGTVKRSESLGMAICFHEDYQMMSIKG